MSFLRDLQNSAAPSDVSVASLGASNPQHSFPDWRNVPEDQRKRLTDLMTRIPIYQGQKLIKYGEEGDTLFFLETGRVTFSYVDDSYVRHYLHEVGPGSFFGEVGMLTDNRRSTDVEVLEQGWAYLLPRQSLNALLRECPDVGRVLLEGMAWRLSNSASLIRGTVKHVPKSVLAPKSVMEAAIDRTVQFMGSRAFLLLNAVLMLGWVVWCLAHGIHDPTKAEFAALALVVSVEALFLSILVLTSQNRQEKDEVMIKQRQEQLLELISQRAEGLHRKLESQDK